MTTILSWLKSYLIQYFTHENSNIFSFCFVDILTSYVSLFIGFGLFLLPPSVYVFLLVCSSLVVFSLFDPFLRTSQLVLPYLVTYGMFVCSVDVSYTGVNWYCDCVKLSWRFCILAHLNICLQLRLCLFLNSESFGPDSCTFVIGVSPKYCYGAGILHILLVVVIYGL